MSSADAVTSQFAGVGVVGARGQIDRMQTAMPVHSKIKKLLETLYRVNPYVMVDAYLDKTRQTIK